MGQTVGFYIDSPLVLVSIAVDTLKNPRPHKFSKSSGMHRPERRKRHLVLEVLEDRQLLSTVVQFTTPAGDLHLEMLPNSAPRTVESFLKTNLMVKALFIGKTERCLKENGFRAPRAGMVFGNRPMVALMWANG